jgi:5-methylthioribose kinase
VVLRVITPDGKMVIKQSRPQLRTRDAWFSDLDRVYREQDVMQLLHPLLPEPTVPRVLFSDRANYVLAMSHAPDDSQVWKETLLSGQVDRAVARLAGSMLGRMHEATARRKDLLEPLRDRTVFLQLRVNPFYERIEERRPEVAPAVAEIVQRMLSVQEALCHGDYSPKNILVHSRGFTLVDYETGHWGDPSMDLGFFLSHLMLKALRHLPRRQEFFELTRSFWQAYAQEISFQLLENMELRAIEHFAVCFLARIDGTSPVDYLPEEPRRQAARRLSRQILGDRPGRWHEVLRCAEAECSRI